jgi:hypothetical protein
MMVKKVILFGLFVGISHPVYADPATHTFAVTSAQTVPGDCGGGSCTSVCKWQAKITNVSPRPMPSATLNFKHPHPGIDPGTLTATGFDIPALAAGVSAPLVEWVYGLKCTEVLIRSVSAKCADSSCPYGAIRILPSSVPRLSAMKVDIDP